MIRIAGLVLGAALSQAGLAAEGVALKGKFGFIGDWELTASLAGGGGSGAYTLRHIASCMPGEVSEKTGSISLSRVTPGARVTARLVMDGAECRFAGRLDEDSHGFVSCPGKPKIPLTLWVE